MMSLEAIELEVGVRGGLGGGSEHLREGSLGARHGALLRGLGEGRSCEGAALGALTAGAYTQVYPKGEFKEM